MENRNFWWRLIFEAVIIFLSVVSAFLIENYREERIEEKNYLANLKIFREEVHGDIRNFLYPMDTSLGGGFYLDNINESRRSIILLMDNDPDSLLLFIQGIERGSDGGISNVLDWRHSSRTLINLYEYNSYIIEDSLMFFLNIYQTAHQNDNRTYADINQRANDVKYLLRGLDMLDQANPKNIELLHNNYELRNAIAHYRGFLNATKFNEMYSVRSMYFATKKIDQVLHQRGVDTTALDKKYLLYYEKNYQDQN